MFKFPVFAGPPVVGILFQPEQCLADRKFRQRLINLCKKLRIEPVLHPGPEWIQMWATIGVILAYERGGLKPRGPKKGQTPRSRIDIELVEAIEYVAQKRNLPFEDLLPHGIQWAREKKKLTADADRTTDLKRLKRVKRRLDEMRRPVGLLNLPVNKPK